MKKIIKCILPVAAMVTALCGHTQDNPFKGTWQGKLNVGTELRIVFHITENASGGWTATMDSPDQSAFGLKCDTTIITGSDITVRMNKFNASYSGKLNNDSTIDGTFKQGAELPLALKKTEKSIERKRPQEPKAPFPYRSEDVEYDNANHSLHYGATITIPEGKGPFPTALLITGSGAQNRDEELMGHKLFLVIADALTRNGIAVLRVDDRGVGKSTGTFSEATSADFAKDVNASLDYLLSRPEVDKKKLGLIGHSEGGMIAPMVGNERSDIDFIILLAGPGIKITDLMAKQNAAILSSVGISQAAIDAYTPLYKDLLTTIIKSGDTTNLSNIFNEKIETWARNTDSSYLKSLGLDDEKGRSEITKSTIPVFTSKWFRYFLNFDPQPYLKKLNCKVLALNGDKDIQVIADPNLAGIEAALKKSKAKKVTIKKMAGLNHLFQACNKCTIAEYGELEETFSPAALKEMNEWLDKNVK